MLIIDLSKALDTVPHRCLLVKLEQYGIGGTLGRWIRGWLTKRTQFVLQEGVASAPVKLNLGFPRVQSWPPSCFRCTLTTLLTTSFSQRSVNSLMIVCYTEMLIVQIMHASLKVIFVDSTFWLTSGRWLLILSP